jgi:microcystin-dependent protein
MTADNTAPPNTVASQITFNSTGAYDLNATNLQVVPSKGVPGRGDNINFLAVTNDLGLQYGELAVGALQIYGAQFTNPDANQGCGGRLSQGPNPFSVKLDTGVFYTSLISTNTLNSVTGNFSTLNATNAQFSTISISSSQGVISNNLVVSTIQAQSGAISTFNAQTIASANSIASPIVNAQTVNTSTLNVSSFVIPNALTISSITASTINVGVISSLIGNFSTLNAPGGTVTPSISTSVAIVKDLFTSTMQFKATLSPNFDLGLGGIIGGLAGGFGANALSVGLGAAGLATGASALVLSRTSGGINPGNFQTINGTAQLQFSTLTFTPGQNFSTPYLLTTSPDPLHTPGNIVITQQNHGSGVFQCVRTVSDPLNLPNSSGTSGQGIQGFSEWAPIFPGKLQVEPNQLKSYASRNFMSFGTAESGNLSRVVIGSEAQIPADFITQIGGQLAVDQGISARDIITTDAVSTRNGYFSTITAYRTPNTPLSTIGIYPGIITSTLQVSTLTFNNSAITNLSVSNVLTVGNNINVTNNVTASNVNLTNINGSPYVPGGNSQPPGSMMIWPCGGVNTGPINVPPGYLYCDGTEYSAGAYPALYAAIANSWGGTPGVSFRVPNTMGRAPFGTLLNDAAGSSYDYRPEVYFQSTNVAGPGVLGGTTNNGWFVTGTTLQVYLGMTYNFGAIGTRKIIKILGTQGVGNGFVTPFVIVWDAPTATTFPLYADGSVAVLSTDSDTTIGPFIGKRPDAPGSGFAQQSQVGSAGITQAIDQTSPHIHTFFKGGRQAGGGAEFTAGDPNVGQDTTPPKDLYTFIVPGAGLNVIGTNTMLNNPPNFGVFYYIKT